MKINVMRNIIISKEIGYVVTEIVSKMMEEPEE